MSRNLLMTSLVVIALASLGIWIAFNRSTAAVASDVDPSEGVGEAPLTQAELTSPIASGVDGEHSVSSAPDMPQTQGAEEQPQGTTSADTVDVPGDNAPPSGVDYGRSPRVPVDANPQVESVAQALVSGENRERISLLHGPSDFDAEAYAQDPEYRKSYLTTVEPSRVFQSLSRKSGGPHITAAGPLGATIERGQTFALRVTVPPGAPCSFTSLGLGEFQNRLTSLTVQAGQDGIAEAQFTATEGAAFDADIMAASPMAVGQLRFVVHIKHPDFD